MMQILIHYNERLDSLIQAISKFEHNLFFLIHESSELESAIRTKFGQSINIVEFKVPITDELATTVIAAQAIDIKDDLLVIGNDAWCTDCEFLRSLYSVQAKSNSLDFMFVTLMEYQKAPPIHIATLDKAEPIDKNTYFISDFDDILSLGNTKPVDDIYWFSSTELFLKYATRLTATEQPASFISVIREYLLENYIVIGHLNDA